MIQKGIQREIARTDFDMKIRRAISRTGILSWPYRLSIHIITSLCSIMKCVYYVI